MAHLKIVQPAELRAQIPNARCGSSHLNTTLELSLESRGRYIVRNQKFLQYPKILDAIGPIKRPKSMKQQKGEKKYCVHCLHPPL